MGLPRPGPAGSCREVPTKRTRVGGEEKPGWEHSHEPGPGILLGTDQGRPGSPAVKTGGAPGWFPDLFASQIDRRFSNQQESSLSVHTENGLQADKGELKAFSSVPY